MHIETVCGYQQNRKEHEMHARLNHAWTASTKRIAILAIALATVSAVAWPPAVYARNNASIRGSVTAPTGDPMPGVTVTASQDPAYGDQPYQDPPVAISDGQGQFFFPAVAAGHYLVQFRLEGFQDRGLQVFVADGAIAKVDGTLSYAKPSP